MSNYNIDEIRKILQGDMLHIPKPILKENVSDNSKMMFSIIFTNSLKNINDFNNASEQVSKLINEHILHITYSEIISECLCDRKRAKKIKKELHKLSQTVDISECFKKM
jgi:uncharacterized protein HemY